MSHCIVPNWNSRHHQRQDQEIQLGEERNSNRSHQSQLNLSTYVVPMSNNYEVGEEMTWESREQPAVVALMHGHSEIIGTGLPPRTKPHTWISRTGDTLESLVHQATNSNSNITTAQQRDQEHDHDRERIVKYSTSIMPGTSSSGKWRENMNISTTSQAQMQVETNTGMSKKMRSINMPLMPYPCGGLRINSMGSSEGNRVEKPAAGLDVAIKKRLRCGKNSGFNDDDDEVEERTSCAGAGASATDTTMMSSWTSFESSPLSPTFKTTATINTTHHHHSHSQLCSENQDEEFENKGESLRSQSSTRRIRAAVVHNQSERRRRDRINEKMKALQKLVPNASKTDKASMLDEVIVYLKQLQAQVHMLSNARTSIPQMVMPFGMQQQLQMSILARMGLMGMGMGMGMGMLDVNMNFPRNVPPSLPPLLHGAPPPIGTTTTTPSFVPPPFTMPSLVPPLISTHLKPNIEATNINRTTSIPNFNDAYVTFLAQQSMNMDFFNKMAALYRQQANQPSKKPNTLSQPNNAQGDQ